MRLRVEHVTTYHYRRPVVFQRHRLVIRPREGHDTHIERLTLQLTPRHRLEWTQDVFGNEIAHVDWLEASDTLQIVNDVIVERTSSDNDTLSPPARVPYPPLYDALETVAINGYLVPSYPEDAASLSDWLTTALVVAPDDAEGTMLALSKLLYATVRYLRRTEKGVQTPGTTLRLQRGSCRDMATLMMDCARVLGVAARFASGYLHGAASMAGRGSTHAWTEVYLPTRGWRGFDPTLGDRISTRHVVTGVSSHPRGVMPVSGTFTGDASDCTALNVHVTTSVLPEA